MNIHFIGIGGIGMSALALLAKEKGYHVQGSDLKKTPLTLQLESLGIMVYDHHRKEHIDSKMMVVISSAIKKDNEELLAAKGLNCKIMHRSDFLKSLMKDKIQIMITGAHGKTTTTALLVHLFQLANKNPSFAIGGLLTDQDHAKLTDGEHFIFEGDESDGSFLNASPLLGIFTNIDKEHLDYWKTFPALLEGYKKAIENIDNPKNVFYCSQDPQLAELAQKGSSFGFLESDSIQARNVHFTPKGMRFLINDQEYDLALYGEHNVLNALACFAVARSCGIPTSIIQKGFKTFKGVKRRFEVIGKIESTTFVDDYAHHPAEIDAVLKVLIQLTPLSKVLVIFEPHKYTRFQELLDDFIAVLSIPIDLVVLPIYSAHQTAIHGLMEEFQKRVKPRNFFTQNHQSIEGFLFQRFQNYDWVITLGAGNVTDVGRSFLKSCQPYHEEKILC